MIAPLHAALQLSPEKMQLVSARHAVEETNTALTGTSLAVNSCVLNLTHLLLRALVSNAKGRGPGVAVPQGLTRHVCKPAGTSNA